jgi:hypothetical protein
VLPGIASASVSMGLFPLNMKKAPKERKKTVILADLP